MPYNDASSLAAQSRIQNYWSGNQPMSMAEAAAGQVYQQKAEQAKQLQEAWPTIQQKLKNLPPEEAYGLLVPLVGPENAALYLEQMRIAQNQQYMRDIIGGGTGQGQEGGMPAEGGAGLTPERKAAIDAMPRDRLEKMLLVPELAPYAKVKLDEIARQEDAGINRKGTAFDEETKLRGEYTNLSKDFFTQRDAYGRVKTSEKDPSAASDVSLIFNFMKLLDPNSVVREAEYATAETAGSIPQRVWAQYNKAVDGERLAPDMRADFIKQAGNIYNVADRQHLKRVKVYTGLAKRKELDPDSVVIDFGMADEEPQTFSVGDQTVTQQEIEATAKNRGMTVEQVKQKLGIQ